MTVGGAEDDLVRRLRIERLARLRGALARADCAGALLLDPVNIRYATDVTNMQVWCLHNPVRYAFVATDGPVVLFDFLHCEFLGEGVETVDEVRPARSWTHLMAGNLAGARVEEWAAEIADLVAAHGGGNPHLAVDRLEWTGHRALERRGVRVVEGQPVAEAARAIKTPAELEAIRDAVGTCEEGVRALCEQLRPGITEQALWAELHRHNIAAGGEWIETRLLVSGPRTNPWYQECSARVIEDGDLVALDTDLIGRHGYCCDVSRTWRAGDGPPDDTQRRTYARAHAHLTRLLDLVRPGVTLTELSETVGPVPDDDLRYSCLIHGVGLCDEHPVAFWAGDHEPYDATLEPGMTLCVESYLGPRDAREGVKLEEQVLLTGDGLEVLSTLPFEEDWL